MLTIRVDRLGGTDMHETEVIPRIVAHTAEIPVVREADFASLVRHTEEHAPTLLPRQHDRNVATRTAKRDPDDVARALWHVAAFGVFVLLALLVWNSSPMREVREMVSAPGLTIDYAPAPPEVTEPPVKQAVAPRQVQRFSSGGVALVTQAPETQGPSTPSAEPQPEDPPMTGEQASVTEVESTTTPPRPTEESSIPEVEEGGTDQGEGEGDHAEEGTDQDEPNPVETTTPGTQGPSIPKPGVPDPSMP